MWSKAEVHRKKSEIRETISNVSESVQAKLTNTNWLTDEPKVSFSRSTFEQIAGSEIWAAKK